MADHPLADGRSAPGTGPSPGARAHDIEPDWFDFDELKKSSSRAQAELSAALGAALAEVEAARREVEPDVHAAPRPPRAQVELAPRPPPPRAETAEVAAPAAPRARAPRPTIALLAVAVAANLLAAAAAWRAFASVDALAGDLGRELRAARSDASITAAGLGAPSPARAPGLPDAERSLEFAARTIAERDFASARRALSELLATADALDSPARGEVEARARFLIADAWRLEAEAAAGAGK